MEKKKKSKAVLSIVAVCLVLAVAFGSLYYLVERQNYARMTFIGHASVKLISTSGKVVYIDPYYPVGDYSEPADYILITHSHPDHNDITKCTLAEGGMVIRWFDALKSGEYKVFDDGEIRIEAVPGGGNRDHNPLNCVGYIVTLDGVSVYHSGDISLYEGIEKLSEKEIDYALYPIDGEYNLNPTEAGEVADIVGATYNIPIHSADNKFLEQQREFSAKGKLTMHFGETIFLKKKR